MGRKIQRLDSGCPSKAGGPPGLADQLEEAQDRGVPLVCATAGSRAAAARSVWGLEDNLGRMRQLGFLQDFTG